MSVSFHIAPLDYNFENPSHHCNFANANAWALFQILNITPDSCGDVAVEDLPALRRSILLARNSISVRTPGVREADDGRGAGGARFIDFGSNDEAVLGRLAALEAVVICAQEMGVPLAWD